jgi:hypothetical protein
LAEAFHDTATCLAYQIVILGFIGRTKLVSRWLSNDEISRGVNRALEIGRLALEAWRKVALIPRAIVTAPTSQHDMAFKINCGDEDPFEEMRPVIEI